MAVGVGGGGSVDQVGVCGSGDAGWWWWLADLRRSSDVKANISLRKRQLKNHLAQP